MKHQVNNVCANIRGRTSKDKREDQKAFNYIEIKDNHNRDLYKVLQVVTTECKQ